MISGVQYVGLHALEQCVCVLLFFCFMVSTVLFRNNLICQICTERFSDVIYGCDRYMLSQELSIRSAMYRDAAFHTLSYPLLDLLRCKLLSIRGCKAVQMYGLNPPKNLCENPLYCHKSQRVQIQVHSFPVIHIPLLPIVKLLN